MKKIPHINPCTTCPIKEEDSSLCKSCAYRKDEPKESKIKIVIIEVEY